ncbi:MAG: efflux RND transporter periplasmic adaptor subunit [Cyanobacteria bacterium P01_F01_bin.116]
MRQLTLFPARTLSWSKVNKVLLWTVVVVPLVVMGVLTKEVLIPALKNPEASYYSSSKGYPAKQRQAGEAIEVDVILVGSSSFDNFLAAPGEVIAQEQVEVRSAVEGVVQEVYVEEGQWVEAGERLIQLESGKLEHDVKIAQLNLETARANLEAVIKSREARFGTLRSKLRANEEQVKNAQAAYAKLSNLISLQQDNNLDALQVQLDAAQNKLDSIRQLAEQGAVSQLQLQDAETQFVKAQNTFLNTQSGNLSQQDSLFDAQNAIIRSRANAQQARQTLERAQTLEEIRERKAALTVENRGNLLKEALRAFDQLQIHAGTSGLVTEIDIDRGEIIYPDSDSSFMVIDQNLLFQAYIDQTRLNEVNVGDSVLVRLVTYPGQPFFGKVVRVNPTIETEDFIPGRVGIDRQYTYSVWVEIPSLELSPGLQGYLHFEKEKTGVVIPESAVTHLSGGEGMVMVVNEDKTVVRSVVLGTLEDNRRKVISGLFPGEVIVVNPNGLNPGDKVKPISSSSTSAD